jgi:transposase
MFLLALGVERAILEDLRFEETPDGQQALVVRVRPTRKEQSRCAQCGRRCPGYDRGEGLRRFRAMDLGLGRSYVEALAPRVRCKHHGVGVQRVPWARSGSGFVRAFEDHLAWLVVRTDKTTVSTLLRIAWRTVGAIVERVCKSARDRIDPLCGITRIGIDEVSYRKGHNYLTVVLDHDTGRLLWAHPGKNEATLHKFFDELGPLRSQQRSLVSADAAPWIASVVKERCPQATLCLDPFHIVKWATEALDEVRRDLWNQLRRDGKKEQADSLKRSRWALGKKPEDLTDKQRLKLSAIEKDNQPLFRAYLLKEQLRSVFTYSGAMVLCGSCRTICRRAFSTSR